ncbi:MAG: response regulator [Nitrospirae bacterium]|nr:MAG: response regulator [Nitrospirota bacterium]
MSRNHSRQPNSAAHEDMEKAKRILIIDDDTLTRGLLRMLFEADGFQCEEAEDGTAALDRLDRGTFDLVITDHQMPGVTGLELLQRLTLKSPTASPPIIFLTGNLSCTLKEDAYRSGASAVLAKPYNLHELRTISYSLLDPRPPR